MAASLLHNSCPLICFLMACVGTWERTAELTKLPKGLLESVCGSVVRRFLSPGSQSPDEFTKSSPSPPSTVAGAARSVSSPPAFIDRPGQLTTPCGERPCAGRPLWPQVSLSTEEDRAEEPSAVPHSVLRSRRLLSVMSPPTRPGQ